MRTALIAWVLAAIFPSTDGLPGLDQIETRPKIAHILERAPLVFRASLYGAALLFLFGPILTVYVPLPAVLLPRGLLDKHAYRLSTHPIYVVRQASLLIKSVGALIWGADASVRERLAMAPLADDPGTWRRGEPMPDDGVS
jgi:hypothetical protein